MYCNSDYLDDECFHLLTTIPEEFSDNYNYIRHLIVHNSIVIGVSPILLVPTWHDS